MDEAMEETVITTTTVTTTTSSISVVSPFFQPSDDSMPLPEEKDATEIISEEEELKEMETTYSRLQKTNPPSTETKRRRQRGAYGNIAVPPLSSPEKVVDRVEMDILGKLVPLEMEQPKKMNLFPNDEDDEEISESQKSSHVRVRVCVQGEEEADLIMDKLVMPRDSSEKVVENVEEAEDLVFDGTQTLNEDEESLNGVEEDLVVDQTQTETDVAEEELVHGSDQNEEANASQSEPSLSSPLTDEQILLKTNELFAAVDATKVTVGDIVRSLEEFFEIRFHKKQKKMVKKRLTDLILGNVELEPEEEEEEEEEEDNAELDDDSSDYEAKPTKKPKKRTRTSKTTPHKKSQHAKYTTRSQTPTGKKRPSHLRIHEEMVRKRQVAEMAKIRSEELQQQSQQLSAEELKRAKAIRDKFETNTEDMRMNRLEERMGLLERLRGKRLGLLCEEEEEKRDMGVLIGNLGKKSESPKECKNQDGVKKEEVKKEETPAMITLEDEEDDSAESDTDSEDELEVLSSKPALSKPLLSLQTAAKDKHPLPSPSPTSKQNYHRQKANANLMNPRMALRNALRQKSIKAGNMWLARELGYKTEQDHIRDCQLVEQRKRQMMLKREKEQQLKAKQREEDGEEEEELDVVGKNGTDEEDEDEEMAMAREIEGEDKHQSQEYGIQDDLDLEAERENQSADDNEISKTTAGELAEEENINGASDVDTTISQAIGEAKKEPLMDRGTASATDDGNSNNTDEMYEDSIMEEGENNQNAVTGKVERKKEDVPEAATNQGITVDKDDDGLGPENDTFITQDDDYSERHVASKKHIVDDVNDETDSKDKDRDKGMDEEDEHEFKDEDAVIHPKKDGKGQHSNKKVERNAAWKAMLQKEADQLKKQKVRKKGSAWVEAEADEEEEEIGVAGLEDFGFKVQNKEKDDDEDDDANAELNEEDLENIVDTLSDDEGDEEAGTSARLALAHKEEKDRHKEIIRRMRDGYDGRRGGVAGGGGSRGVHRFEQLVAADNREDAKRLGLLNDDELDSDNEDGGENDGNEKKKKGDDEDDEAELLDKMLKERFLNRDQLGLPEENFSEDEEEEDENGEEGNGVDGEDKEDREQDRLAKRFAKRARMQRLLETYDGEGEFSQTRLIDEDKSTRNDLRAMKSARSRKRRQISTSSLLSSISREESDSQSSSNDAKQLFSKRQKSSETTSSSENSNGLSNCGALSIALGANRHRLNKRKTSFMSGGSNGAMSRSNSLSKKGATQFSHFVFNTESSSSQVSSRANGSSGPAVRRSASLPKNYKSGAPRKGSTGGARGGSTSLWSKVSANSFRRS